MYYFLGILLYFDKGHIYSHKKGSWEHFKEYKNNLY